jgi:hypothetical protein
MLPTRARLASLLVLLMVVTACAGRPTAGRPAPDRNVLSSEEMLKAGYPDAFMTVQALRPQWLQRRGATSIRSEATIKVYLDGSLLGGVDHLKQITTRSISTIRHYDELEASQRWGLDHGQGAIAVSTRRG